MTKVEACMATYFWLYASTDLVLDLVLNPDPLKRGKGSLANILLISALFEH